MADQDEIAKIVYRVVTGQTENIAERIGHEILEFFVYGKLYEETKKLFREE